MGTASRLGLMEQNILVSGAKTELMVRENSYTSTEMFTMAFGQTIKPTVLASTDMLMAQCTRGNGKMICNTEEESKLGLIKVATKATTLTAESMVLEATNGTTEVSTLATGVKTKLVE
jgi:hypothetical protein